MRSILFSTTRQFNPGDEFILHGIRRMLKKAGIVYNACLYNRYQSMRIPLTRVEDLSFHLDDDQGIDYVIFAGSPEWWQAIPDTGLLFREILSGNGKSVLWRRSGLHMGARVITPLLTYIVKNNLRCSFIGVGNAGGKIVISKLLDKVLRENTDLLIARDRHTASAISAFNPVLASCPALFSSEQPRQRGKLSRIGFVFQKQSPQGEIDKHCYRYLIDQVEKAANHFPDLQVICHTLEDYMEAKRLFPATPSLHSSFSEDWEEIYDTFDFIVGSRVHGAGIASSLGIPNILIDHSRRCQTAELFGTHILQVGESVIPHIEQTDIVSESKRLIKLRKEAEMRYLDYFKGLSFRP